MENNNNNNDEQCGAVPQRQRRRANTSWLTSSMACVAVLVSAMGCCVVPGASANVVVAAAAGADQLLSVAAKYFSTSKTVTFGEVQKDLGFMKLTRNVVHLHGHVATPDGVLRAFERTLELSNALNKIAAEHQRLALPPPSREMITETITESGESVGAVDIKAPSGIGMTLTFVVWRPESHPGTYTYVARAAIVEFQLATWWVYRRTKSNGFLRSKDVTERVAVETPLTLEHYSVVSDMLLGGGVEELARLAELRQHAGSHALASSGGGADKRDEM